MHTLDINSIIERLAQVAPQQNKAVPLHQPLLNGNEWKYVKDCLDTGWVSTVGQYVNQFEHALAEYTGVKHAIAVVNGTSALHACLHVLDINNQCEVLLPALTFVATANAVAYTGATPHFVDVDEETLGIDADRLDKYLSNISETKNNILYNKISGKIIKAIIPVNTFGHPVNIDKIKTVAEKYNLKIIEDAAESLGSYYANKHTGSDATLATLSFNGNKIITSGGGGAVLTNDDALATKLRHMTSTAKKPHAWEYDHDVIGFNYRMPNINAAIGLAQLENIEEFIEKKRNIAQHYINVFSDIQNVYIYKEAPYAKSNYWLNLLVLDDDVKHELQHLLKTTNEHNYLTRPAWRLLHQLPMYTNAPRMNLAKSESLAARIMCLPSSASLSMAN